MRDLFLFVMFSLLLGACGQKKASDALGATQGGKPLFVGQQIDTSLVLSTIAFGSCNRQDLPQDMWSHILEQTPNLWIWLGDNIYGDSDDMSVMKAKYLRQKYAPAYQIFREKVPVIGTWDDHDFGANDAGKEFPKRSESQELMLNFLDVPADAAVRFREGVYQSFTFGPPGKMVKIILLDSRYHRDKPIKKTDGRGYLANEKGTILGEDQWIWFEKELANSDAQIHLIGNGIQVIPEDHDFEKWQNFPRERARLFNLLKKYQVANPILLSGDRHIAEISKWEEPAGATPIYEITSSGLTHSYEAVGEEPNRHRVSRLIGEKNFGLIRIDWSTPSHPLINLELRGKSQTLHTAVQINY